MPAVHDLTSVQRDALLYEGLYRKTVRAAEPVIRHALEEVTAGAAAQLLEKQLSGLRQFVLDLPTHTEQPDPELREALHAFVRADLGRDNDVLELSNSLTAEFAVGFWDWMLQRMRRHASEPGKAVARADLDVPVSSAEDGSREDGWIELDEFLVPFSISRTDAARILREVLTMLHDSEVTSAVRLPLGLSIDKPMLHRVIQREQEPQVQDQGMMNFLRNFLGL